MEYPGPSASASSRPSRTRPLGARPHRRVHGARRARQEAPHGGGDARPLRRIAAAGAELVVFHPGFLLGRERADALAAVVEQLDRAAGAARGQGTRRAVRHRDHGPRARARHRGGRPRGRGRSWAGFGPCSTSPTCTPSRTAPSPTADRSPTFSSGPTTCSRTARRSTSTSRTSPSPTATRRSTSPTARGRCAPSHSVEALARVRAAGDGHHRVARRGVHHHQGDPRRALRGVERSPPSRAARPRSPAAAPRRRGPVTAGSRPAAGRSARPPWKSVSSAPQRLAAAAPPPRLAPDRHARCREPWSSSRARSVLRAHPRGPRGRSARPRRYGPARPGLGRASAGTRTGPAVLERLEDLDRLAQIALRARPSPLYTASTRGCSASPSSPAAPLSASAPAPARARSRPRRSSPCAVHERPGLHALAGRERLPLSSASSSARSMSGSASSSSSWTAGGRERVQDRRSPGPYGPCPRPSRALLRA